MCEDVLCLFVQVYVMEQYVVCVQRKIFQLWIQFGFVECDIVVSFDEVEVEDIIGEVVQVVVLVDELYVK